MQNHNVQLGDTYGQIRHQPLNVNVIAQAQYYSSSLPCVRSDRRPLTAGLSQAVLKHRPATGSRVRQLFDFKAGTRRTYETLPVEVPQTMDHSMRRKYRKPVRLHADKRRHYVFCPLTIYPFGPAVITICECRLVAVMTIGDDQLLGPHGISHVADCSRVRSTPDRI